MLGVGSDWSNCHGLESAAMVPAACQPRVARSHYELSFEALLNHRGTPFVSVEEVRRNVPGRVGIKSFDYIVYPPAGRACLVDVKGRKTPVGPACRGRLKNWVTEADVAGLGEWQAIFGSDFQAVFVFAYWLAPTAAAQAGSPESDLPDGWHFAGRAYHHYVIPLDSYARHAQPLSKRWQTVAIPRERFIESAVRLADAWAAAPC